ncbi:MAG TPA: NTP transferase domain-containing protein, partial [Gaiellaceae bacterium]|nr:NTP transferase domain-containing protein [Gaiellaceae bacterium]
MNGSELAAVVLAGGLGTRMRSSRPKHLHPLLGRRLVDWVIVAGRALDPARLVVVASPDYAGEFDGL